MPLPVRCADFCPDNQSKQSFHMTSSEFEWSELLSSVDANTFPTLTCPTCGIVALKLDPKKISYQRLKNQYESNVFENETFDAGVVLNVLKALVLIAEEIKWEQCRFNGHLTCANCGDVTTFLGKAKVPNQRSSAYHSTLVPRLIPEFFSPPVPLITLRSDYPLEVRAELVRSFALFFSDSAAAANRIRICVELVLNDLQIDAVRRDAAGKAKSSASGREVKLTLGERIKLFAVDHGELAELLGAIKGIGNEGSHGCELSRSDLLDAYAMIDHILTALYVTSKTRAQLLGISNKFKQKYG